MIFRSIICVAFCFFLIGCHSDFKLNQDEIAYCYNGSKSKVKHTGDIQDRFAEQSFFVFLDGNCVSCLIYLDAFSELIYSNPKAQNFNWFFCLSINNEFDFTERITRVLIPQNGKNYFLGFKGFSNDFLEEGTVKFVENGSVENVFRFENFDNIQNILSFIESEK